MISKESILRLVSEIIVEEFPFRTVELGIIRGTVSVDEICTLFRNELLLGLDL